MKTWRKRIGAVLVGLAVFGGVLVATPQAAMAGSSANVQCGLIDRYRSSTIYAAQGQTIWISIHATWGGGANWYIKRWVSGNNDPVVKGGYLQSHDYAQDFSTSWYVNQTANYYLELHCAGVGIVYGAIAT